MKVLDFLGHEFGMLEDSMLVDWVWAGCLKPGLVSGRRKGVGTNADRVPNAVLWRRACSSRCRSYVVDQTPKLLGSSPNFSMQLGTGQTAMQDLAARAAGKIDRRP